MVQRRAYGSLEAEVLGALWSQDRALTPAEVNELLGSELAYTTIMTVLVRLWEKGLAERVHQGRAFAYRPALSESELATQRMNKALNAASDRSSVLAHFVGTLSKRDVRDLKRLLGGGGGRSS